MPQTTLLILLARRCPTWLAGKSDSQPFYHTKLWLQQHSSKILSTAVGPSAKQEVSCGFCVFSNTLSHHDAFDARKDNQISSTGSILWCHSRQEMFWAFQKKQHGQNQRGNFRVYEWGIMSHWINQPSKCLGLSSNMRTRVDCRRHGGDQLVIFRH